MSQPYVGEIRIFAGSFAPAGWFLCDGQHLQISEYETLFNLIGTYYGGDGQSDFALPDLRGRSPMHRGSTFDLAEMSGVESVTLSVTQIPLHTHSSLAATAATTPNPAGAVLAESIADRVYSDTATTTLRPSSLTAAGGSQPHENMQPFLAITFIISAFGIFPSQT